MTTGRPSPLTLGGLIQADRNREASFWQSRHPRHERIEITDLRALARAIRSTYP